MLPNGGKVRRIAALVLVLAALSLAGTMTQTVGFAPADLQLTAKDGYTVVNLVGALSTLEPGSPCLPLVNLNLLIPPDAEITGVEVLSSEHLDIPGDYRVYPAQPVRPLLDGVEVPFLAPDAHVYQRNQDYPGRLVEFTPSGSKSGYRIAGITVYPVQYNPAASRLTLYTRLELKVAYQEKTHPVLSITRSQAELFGRDVASIIVNPDKVKTFAPQTREADGAVDYCIITPASLVASWQPLLTLRQSQGLNAIAMPVETIYARYTGTDNPAKIRAFITDYWQNQGLKWVVLGGDHGLVPTRYGYLPYSTYNIPADVYYADLDWSWDSNHNGQYGEMTGDTLDLFGDVYVGRIPCDNATQVGTFIAKDTTYELHPDTTYLHNSFLPWEWLWSNIGHGGFLVNNNIKAILPQNWQVDVVSQPGPTQTLSYLNGGEHFMHFAGHGNYDVFGSAFSISNVPSLTNMASRKLTIINSMACFCGEFDDQECLGEALMNASNGGSVAAMLNARYGWGAPPNMGPGEHFSQEFYRQYQLQREVGVASGLVKDYFRNVSMSQMTYRWTTYVLTSFMDPAMPMWTRTPQTMLATHPESIPGAPGTVRVSVNTGDGPLADAIVSLLDGSTVIACSRTNSQGWVELPVYPDGGATLALRVTARDFLPYQGTIYVQAACTAPRLVLQSTDIDPLGNSRLDPGETADLYFTLKNDGTAPAGSVTGILQTACPYVTLLDSLATYGAIAPGDTARGDRYQVAVAADCPIGTQAEFWVRAAATEGAWTPFCRLTVGAPLQHGMAWATHDTGAFILSVTALGSVGATGWRAEGIGLIFPKDYPWSASRLMLGSLALGIDPSYVADRFYHPNYPANDSDFVMLDSVRAVIPPARAAEEFTARFSDAGHPNTRNLEITQRSMVNARAGINTFCILEYDIANPNPTATDPMTAGMFCDFKMTGWNVNDSFDIAAAESSYRMAYVYTGDTAAIGVKLIYPPLLQGLSVIDGYNYIQRAGMMNDATKDSFLWGRKTVMSGATNRNWAGMVSTQPFSIAPEFYQRVAFAIVMGRSRAQLRANADSAQNWYDVHTAVTEPELPAASPLVQFRITPSVFRHGVAVSYGLPADGLIRIQAFDAAGRLLETVLDARVNAPGTATWQPKALIPGIYFLKVNGQMAKVVYVSR
jgi:hypothetical protein